MKEINGNLWDYADKGAIVITTNGTVKQNGECVMGRGVALDAKKRWKGLPLLLGDTIRVCGNHVARHMIVMPNGMTDMVFTFPVKHNWWEKADLELIARSAKELAAKYHDYDVYLPRPGCGNGGLKWEDVKPIIEPLLDDRFTIVHRP